MTHHPDIVARLRKMANRIGLLLSDPPKVPEDAALMLEAAALIEAQAAEIAGLREELAVAAGRLHWAGSATPGAAHPDGKALVLEWAAKAAIASGVIEEKGSE